MNRLPNLSSVRRSARRFAGFTPLAAIGLAAASLALGACEPPEETESLIPSADDATEQKVVRGPGAVDLGPGDHESS